ncbi:MAG: type VII secretion-associated serine protease, partial [Rhodococcus sp. (in: high G+C Gram-positive bacteria)]
MKRRITRVVLATAIVAVTAAVGQGGATAAVPAPVDVGLVPPADRQKADLRRSCKDAVRVPDGPDVPAAQRDLDFQSVWPITRGAGQLVAVIDT